ncbi:unnamed protein product [Symbiodinium sp. CCMP2592]|nr:unnamed protein product [Symbiodinium sp. CCMP2592]
MVSRGCEGKESAWVKKAPAGAAPADKVKEPENGEDREGVSKGREGGKGKGRKGERPRREPRGEEDLVKEEKSEDWDWSWQSWEQEARWDESWWDQSWWSKTESWDWKAQDESDHVQRFEQSVGVQEVQWEAKPELQPEEDETQWEAKPELQPDYTWEGMDLAADDPKTAIERLGVLERERARALVDFCAPSTVLEQHRLPEPRTLGEAEGRRARGGETVPE